MRRLLDRFLAGRRPPDNACGPLADDERLLGWATTVDDAAVVVTSRGLWWPAEAGTARLDWHDILKASWSDGELAVLAGEEVEPGVVRDGVRRVVWLAEPRNVPEEVRARVTRSVAHSSHHVLPGGGGVRVVARRVAGEDGLTWLLRFDSETDRTDAAARAEAERLLDEVRAQNDPAI